MAECIAREILLSVLSDQIPNVNQVMKNIAVIFHPDLEL